MRVRAAGRGDICFSTIRRDGSSVGLTRGLEDRNKDEVFRLRGEAGALGLRRASGVGRRACTVESYRSQ